MLVVTKDVNTGYERVWRLSSRNARGQRGKPSPFGFEYTRAQGPWGLLHASVYCDQQPHDAECYAAAFDSFSKQLGPKGSAGLTALDLPKSVGMVGNRLQQLVSIAAKCDALTKASLRRRRSSKRDGYLKTWSNHWLEYTFGWAPLVEDIHNLTEVFKTPPRYHLGRIKGTATREGVSISQTDIAGDTGLPYAKNVGSGEVKYILSANVFCTNHNARFAQQLGLANPLAVAWDAIPLSFLADWALHLNKFFESLSFDFGLEMEQIYRTRVTKWKGVYMMLPMSRPEAEGPVSSLKISRETLTTIPIPGITARIHVPAADAWKCVTSAALLTQKFRTPGVPLHRLIPNL